MSFGGRAPFFVRLWFEDALTLGLALLHLK
jgi:hypothetical protein